MAAECDFCSFVSCFFLSLNQLQKSKEREEQLEEMIQAYEKLCVEKTDLESELGQMVGFNYFPGHALPPHHHRIFDHVVC